MVSLLYFPVISLPGSTGCPVHLSPERCSSMPLKMWTTPIIAQSTREVPAFTRKGEKKELL